MEAALGIQQVLLFSRLLAPGFSPLCFQLEEVAIPRMEVEELPSEWVVIVAIDTMEMIKMKAGKCLLL